MSPLFRRAAGALACLWALPGIALAAPDAPTARVFVPVAQPGRALGADWARLACRLLPQPCDPDTLAAYRARGQDAASMQVEVLAARPLAWATLRREGADGPWVRVSLHDFTGYAHRMEDTTDGVPRLAPALYPLGADRWAVAIVAGSSESYSGGGARFEWADFVPLAPDGKAAAPVHAGVPFSCSKMVRACFSEKDYATSPHCHDESSGSLRIRYAPPARPGGELAWRFAWQQGEWPASRARPLPAGAAVPFVPGRGAGPAFCGGPQ